ncbi:hypothetical protein A3I34_02425 [Candidatus Jorgensenbacteria bacterium RIFCSPLOWO2_02_FULL_45_12]|uniref:Uncharacterized protein n=2 Tax=Candidatus Joergenseniibacteriota TaxID=1752739 RepID=A0A1F6BN75_9BACT|nr:MAG: hypothetical protein A3D55_01210 [Candidatus Jorgensenbacteria bacterium RIFCSPHIGHO2_02_FULL_45_20]OGG42614.1 MAG: hypothetical protein A3I34_02425 [Candidatus Jorgensenbacteria bacterium RIFCSPLOWO2_02_FULL_45_12]
MKTETCQNCKQVFEITSDDEAFYKKMEVPAPGICPDCRFRHKALFRNESTLYNRKCDFCKKPIITSYHPDSRYVVFCNSCWHSDKWDSRSYAIEYNPKKRFIEQLGELLAKTPKSATYTSNFSKSINSEYINFSGGKGGTKNCFLYFNSGEGEDSMYCRGVRSVRKVGDAYYGGDLDICYEVINAEKSSSVSFSQNVNGCLDSSFLRDSSGCSDCFGCVNIRHGKYKFMNEQLSKDSYAARISEIKGSYAATEKFREEFEKFSLSFPRRENVNLKAITSSGDFLFETKNVRDSFETVGAENSRFLYFAKTAKDSYDVIGFGYDSELLLETVGVGYTSRAVGCVSSDNSRDIEYCFATKQSENCFGCDGLKNGKWCILNSPYAEEEYKKLRGGIIDEMKKEGTYGLAFPQEIAPYAYNETIGQDNLPLTKEEAIARGFGWQENIQITRGKETLEPSDIPDHIRDVPSNICSEILKCLNCERNYRIIPQELQLYKELVVPLPRKCFFCRHKDRIHRRGPFKLFSRKCDKCGKDIRTTFSTDRPEIVYCEACYQSEVA